MATTTCLGSGDVNEAGRAAVEADVVAIRADHRAFPKAHLEALVPVFADELPCLDRTHQQTGSIRSAVGRRAARAPHHDERAKLRTAHHAIGKLRAQWW
jgi:hypothetical protein